MHRMLQHNIGRLPVVSRENPQQMVGYFNRASMLGAWTRQIEDEGLREHGWIRKWRNSDKSARGTSRDAER
jgi:CIC family chloride channel protein